MAIPRSSPVTHLPLAAPPISPPLQVVYPPPDVVELPIPEFKAHRLFPGGHLQTIAAAFLPPPKIAYQARQHRISLADGDQLVLHDDTPHTWKPGGPIVLLLHGLGGCHRSSYVVRAAHKLNALGVRTFALDLRGCGAGFDLARWPTHAGRSEDAAAAVSCVRKMCPASPLIVVGYSMSGNVVLKMTGEYGDHVPAALDSVIAVSPPVDLEACSITFRQGWNRLYDRYYLRRCLKAVSQKKRLICSHTYRVPTREPRTLREFDDLYTAPIAGFRDAGHYYSEASSVPLVPRIQVPTLILSAVDDPIIPAYTLTDLKRPEHVRLHLASGGGHLGFYARRGNDPDRQWLDWRILDWVKLRFGL
jgi:uncharacterized protein